MEQVQVAGVPVREQLTYQGVLMVNVDVAYPAVTGGAPRRCARRFNDTYEKEARRQLKTARDELYPGAVEDYKFSQEKGYPFNHYELMQVFDVTLNALPLLSVYYDVYQYTGGAHGMTDRTGSTWDLQRCSMLPMSALFRRGYDYESVIYRYVEAEAARRQQTGEAQYFEGLPGNIRRYFSEKNYYLSCQGLQVFYPLYSIAPYYVGIQVFTVPWAMFGEHLAYPVPELCG